MITSNAGMIFLIVLALLVALQAVRQWKGVRLNDLLWTQGNDNLAGVVGEVWACPSDDIATPPVLTAATSLSTTSTSIVCKSTKKFARIYFTDETAKYEPKMIGERDGKGRESMISGRYPALGVELEDFCRQWQNTPAVIIFRLGAKW